MQKSNILSALACFGVLAMTIALPAFVQASPYTFKHGFPANEETIRQAQDATDLRRAIEAYKFFFPTVATEAVIQQFAPHGAIPNKAGIIMPQDPEQQFSVANPLYTVQNNFEGFN